ncbi:ABC transporter ATP-binding protein [Streptomyces sp. NPDC051776]|uniref:ABC transporter ATP-binding protein n=1 Tax=Streptomyces sp. NPDC051776 TaxID=3155414 RepID=UPI003412BB91
MSSGDHGGADLAIWARELCKGYGDRQAVKDLDLQVERGEIFAVLGPNGAGKTTTTEILEGYRPRDAGEVRVLGQDPGTAGPVWRSRIGIVLQETGDFDELTVDEVLRHFARYYPAPLHPAEVAESVGLADRRTARVSALSGGQRRRLDVGLGILGRPELLFLDEPTTGFDPEVRRQFWDLIAALRNAGTTVWLTTHYLEEAEHLADRVAVIVNGRVVAVDTPACLGGRHLAGATVGWREDDRTQELVTGSPAQVVQELSARFGGDVPDLVVTRPTLEDIYLDMIGAQQ